MPNRSRSYPWEQFTAVRRIWGLDFSPDGREVIYATNTSGQFNVWKQGVTGGWPWQLTAFEEEAVRTVAWSPSGDRIIFSADKDGNELYDLYSLTVPGGWPGKLTDNFQVQYNLVGPDAISPDGSRIAYASNEREPSDMDSLLMDLKTGETQTLIADEGVHFTASFSPNGRYVVAVRIMMNTDTDILLCDLQEGGVQNLTAHVGQVVHFPGPWSPDSSGFYVMTDRDREYQGLAHYDLGSRRLEWVETPDWDIDDVDLSSDGRYLAWVVNEDGLSKLYVRDTRTDELLDLPELPKGVISTLAGGIGFSPDGRTLALYVATARRPVDLFTLDLENGTLRQLTHSMIGNIPEEDLAEPELIRYPTFDDREIPAWLYKPRAMGPQERVPAVLSIHGGPEAQERLMYNYAGLYQYLLNRGIAVLAPNIRGSSGYGKSYQQLIHRDWGGDELKDLEAAAQYLQGVEWIDDERLGVFGGSFGGFATLSCATRLPDYWAAAVDIVGPSNLVTFLKAVPPYWKHITKAWLGDPEEDHDFLMERSPISYAERIRCPILIIQGANDPRVVQGESDQIVEKLRSLGRDVEYMVFEDEGHGFTKRSNELKAWRATAEFLESRLLGGKRRAG